MKTLNEVIIETEKKIEVITRRLSNVLRVKANAVQLDNRLFIYMNQQCNDLLETALENLDIVTLNLVNDMDDAIKEALIAFSAEDEVDAYAAMFAEDDLSEEGLDSQKLEELLDKEEQAAKEVTLEEIGIDQEGGAV